MNGAAFLREVVEVFPYKLHTVLTDNGMAFADLSKNRGRYQPVDKIVCRLAHRNMLWFTSD